MPCTGCLSPSARCGLQGRPPPWRQAPWRYGFHATLALPLDLASIALFEGSAPGAPFVLRQRFALRPLS